MKIGEKVRTVQNPGFDPRGWLPECLPTRRWGVVGMIVAHHDSHGESYEVQHDEDGTIGHYEPQELVSLRPIGVTLIEHQAKTLLQMHGLALREGFPGLDCELLATIERAFPHLKRDNYFRDSA